MPGWLRSERGSAIVDFTLVSMVFIPLVAGLIQFGLFLHVRNTMVACAHEGARVAANFDTTIGQGVARADGCIRSALNPRFANDISPGMDSVDGQQVVTMTARAGMPMFGYFGPNTVTIVARGHAINEAG